ncbi:hypothetical protein RD792_017017 [Penstemon davidsonii]|uniref:dolichyl-P-Man:Man5GlcNAc2-PP-dolichol alpha-1,3-mannosyltransferase n=1 Tax=Penstemon davidsonii TaxID=160366 RepID=A0ABR0CLE7_9LAMI|nr:hypothetical protein RD792_017017 [Penstemon davidsonii]
MFMIFTFLWLQIFFGVLYVVNLGMVLLLYLKTDVHNNCLAGVIDILPVVKMNVLLYAPPLLLLLLKAMNIFGVISALAGAALVQILGRIFIHFWSVNFKFVPEPVFVSKGFALLLLAVHLILLAIFAHYRWCK